MKKLFLLLLVVQCILCLEVFAQSDEGVKKGMIAPNFSGKDENGNIITLNQYRGRKVVLYFYPKDDSPGCTAQACNLRDNYDTLTKSGFVILGISTDDQTSHQKFKSKHSLPFTLLADSDTSITKQYGVWIEKEKNGQKYWGTARTTFIIDEKGVILNRIDKVDTKNHAEQLLSK